MNIPLAIRRVIYQHFNDTDTIFTNDQILEIMIKGGMIEKSSTIDDMECYFQSLCKAGVIRNVAQNFTTMYLKLFEPLQPAQCEECGQIPLYSEEPYNCIVCGSTVTQ